MDLDKQIHRNDSRYRKYITVVKNLLKNKQYKELFIKIKTKIERKLKNFKNKIMKIKRKILKSKKVGKLKRKIKYIGLRYKCNMCGSRVREMFPDGHKHAMFNENKIVAAGYREHVRCPVCMVKDKERMVFYYIKKYTNILTKKNVILHFAPETDTKKKILKNKKAIYYNGDIQEKNADMKIDITNIQFASNTFDYIICNHVLEHVLDEKKAILELKRVIKPGGKIILTVPICISNDETIEDPNITSPEDRMRLFCQHDHVRLYGNDFSKRIEKYGLQVLEYNFEKEEGKRKLQKYGILENGCIYIASKK